MRRGRDTRQSKDTDEQVQKQSRVRPSSGKRSSAAAAVARWEGPATAAAGLRPAPPGRSASSYTPGLAQAVFMQIT